MLAYRVWFDQRRGWRYTNPNLEQLKLLEVEYDGIEALAEDESLYANASTVLRHATPAVRARVFPRCSTTCGRAWPSRARCSKPS